MSCMYECLLHKCKNYPLCLETKDDESQCLNYQQGMDTLTICWVKHAFEATADNLHQLGLQIDCWAINPMMGEQLTWGSCGHGDDLGPGCKQSLSSTPSKDASITDSINLSYMASRLYWTLRWILHHFSRLDVDEPIGSLRIIQEM